MRSDGATKARSDEGVKRKVVLDVCYDVRRTLEVEMTDDELKSLKELYAHYAIEGVDDDYALLDYVKDCKDEHEGYEVFLSVDGVDIDGKELKLDEWGELIEPAAAAVSPSVASAD